MRHSAPKEHDFRLDIQGLRAVAVLLVVLYHARFSIPQTLEFSGGFVGVDVFFVISGFVVGGALYRELQETGRIKFLDFLMRRAKRLLPALGIAIGATLILSLFAVSLEFLEASVLTGLAATFFGANVWLWSNSSNYFADDNAQNPLLHTWSLSLEEQFYILFLIVLVAMIRFSSRFGIANPWKKFVTITVTLFLLSLTYSLVQISFDQTTAFYSPFARSWQFLLGVLLYLYISKLERPFRSISLAAAMWLVGLSLIGYSAIFFSDGTLFPGVNAITPTLGTALVILSRTFAPQGLGSRILEIPPLVAIGNISYSWYLWHWPFIVFADFWWVGSDEVALGAALLALIPASVSYALIEQPFRRYRIDSRPQIFSFFSLSFLIPVTVAGAGLLANELAFKSLEENDSFLATVRIEQEQIQGNFGGGVNTDGKLDFVIVGDSHAATFAQGLAVVAAEQDRKIGVLSQGRGCLLLEGPYTGTRDEDCGAWQEETLSALVTLDVETVILHGYATGRLTGYNRGLPYLFEISDEFGTPANSLSEALTLYEEGLRQVVRTLVDSGKQVVLLTTFPDFNRPLPTTLPENRTTAYEVFSGTYPQVREEDIEAIPLEVAQKRNRPLLEIEELIASAHPEVLSIDLSPYSCQNKVCTQWRDGVLLYSDMDHITSVHALRLSEVLLELLSEATQTPTRE